MKGRDWANMALLGLFFFGLSYGVFTPKAEAAYFTETPELNQVVPLSPMMDPEYAATVEKARRENISFEEAREREYRERQIRSVLFLSLVYSCFFGAIKVIPSLIRGMGRGIIAVDNARQKIKRTSLRDIGEKLANGNNRRHP